MLPKEEKTIPKACRNSLPSPEALEEMTDPKKLEVVRDSLVNTLERWLSSKPGASERDVELEEGAPEDAETRDPGARPAIDKSSSEEPVEEDLDDVDDPDL